MDTDIQKLCKILPTLNGRRTSDIFIERYQELLKFNSLIDLDIEKFKIRKKLKPFRTEDSPRKIEGTVFAMKEKEKEMIAKKRAETIAQRAFRQYAFSLMPMTDSQEILHSRHKASNHLGGNFVFKRDVSPIKSGTSNFNFLTQPAEKVERIETTAKTPKKKAKERKNFELNGKKGKMNPRLGQVVKDKPFIMDPFTLYTRPMIPKTESNAESVRYGSAVSKNYGSASVRPRRHIRHSSQPTIETNFSTPRPFE